LQGHRVLLDGEIVCLAPEGCPRFDDLLTAAETPSSAGFDLLWLDGRDLRSLALFDRKAELERIVPVDSRLLYVRHIEAAGIGLFTAVCQNDLEGSSASGSTGRIWTGATAIRAGAKF
jgi:bifunctional non-homologous end joining protein LigD